MEGPGTEAMPGGIIMAEEVGMPVKAGLFMPPGIMVSGPEDANMAWKTGAEEADAGGRAPEEEEEELGGRPEGG